MQTRGTVQRTFCSYCRADSSFSFLNKRTYAHAWLKYHRQALLLMVQRYGVATLFTANILALLAGGDLWYGLVQIKFSDEIIRTVHDPVLHEQKALQAS